MDDQERIAKRVREIGALSELLADPSLFNQSEIGAKVRRVCGEGVLDDHEELNIAQISALIANRAAEIIALCTGQLPSQVCFQLGMLTQAVEETAVSAIVNDFLSHMRAQAEQN